MGDLWFWVFLGAFPLVFALRTDKDTPFVYYLAIFSVYVVLLVIQI